MKSLLTCLALVLALTLPALLPAQYGLDAAELRLIPALDLPAQDNVSLLAAEEEARKAGRANKFAVALPVAVRPSTDGRWTQEDGRSVWRVRVYSPGAHTLNLGFSEYNLPAGAELFLLGADEKYGPFTAADNEDHNQLWTPLLEGDDLVVELRVPTAAVKEVQLFLTAVNHDFQGVTKFLSGACNLDVICGEADGWGIVDGYRDIIRSVAAYTVSGTDVCTGFLVNNVNQDGTPFFMTANHCGVGNNSAPALVAYWNFESDECRQPGSTASGQTGFGVRNIFNSGATHLASYANSDVTITLLDDPVNPDANAFFAGWDADELLPSDTTIAVHHPGVDEKRISFSFNQTYRTNNGGGTPNPEGNLLEVPDWSIGTTEGGSSGSPIFDVTGHVRGQLFGGQAACGNDAYDVYGYFPVSWEGGGTPESRLKDWLDPCGTGTLRIEGLEYSDALFALSAESNCVNICAGAMNTFNLTAGTGYPAGTTVAVTSAPDVLSASLSTNTVAGGDDFNLLIDSPADLAAGTYTVIVTATSAAGTDDIELVLNATSGTAAAPEEILPTDGETGVGANINFEWEPVAAAFTYEFELSLEADFSTLVESLFNLEQTTYNIGEPLPANTTHYWRVRSYNACGPGEWATYQFTTGNISCAQERGSDLPVSISSSGTPTTTVVLNSTTTGSVDDMEVTIRIDHTFVGDLDADLTGPDGTTIRLFNEINGGACGGDNMFVVFSDVASQTATDFEEGCMQGDFASRGTYQPAESFQAFVNEGVFGEWTLTVRDNANFDGGTIVDFSISFCGEDVTGTQDFGSDRTVSVYPNPVRNLLTIDAAGNWPGDLHGTMFNTAGQLVNRYVLNRSGRTELNVAGLPAGIYYLRLDGAGQQRTERIVILP